MLLLQEFTQTQDSGAHYTCAKITALALCETDFKILLLVYKTPNGPGRKYISDLGNLYVMKHPDPSGHLGQVCPVCPGLKRASF